MTDLLRTAAAAVALFLCACSATPRYSLPMSDAQLGPHPAVSALVAYLGQPAASPGPCDPAETPALRDAPDLGAGLMSSLDRGRIPPATWTACAALVLSTPGPARDDLALRALRAQVALLTTGRKQMADAERTHASRLHESLAPLVELTAEDLAVAAALRDVYAGRPPDASVPRADLARAVQAVRERLPDMTGARRSAAQAFAAVLEAERGAWRGEPVDPTALDVLAAGADEASLALLARRLPDASLRTEAARRLVRLRIAGSPFPEVRSAAAAVEERVLRLGANPISTAEHPVRAVRADGARRPARTAVVEQRWDAAPRLLGQAAGAAPGLLAEVPLQGALLFEADGISRSITVCAAAGALDPTPCLAAGDLRADSPLARVDGRGALRVSDQLSAAERTALAETSSLVVNVGVRGGPQAPISWPLRFGAPGDLVLAGADDGGRGPDLVVTARRTASGRLQVQVEGSGPIRQAVLEAADARGLQVTSRGGAGAAGAPGVPGTDGAAGSPGMSGSCPDGAGSPGGAGGAGSDGGPGGPGGPGGRGGDVEVIVSAPPALRADTLDLVRALVRSEGGPGGAGGAGGRRGSGGDGGPGGSGASCWDADGNYQRVGDGDPGPDGPDGRDGPDGPSGPPGDRGEVHVRFAE